MKAIIGTDIEYAKNLLTQGEVVGIPTETVYGLAANAMDDAAVLKIFTVKNRPSFDPLIVHTDCIEKINDFVENLPQEAISLFEQFSPGALTILLPKKNNISDLISSGLPRIGVRIPKHPLTLQLLATLDFPLAAPSANPFGYVSPTSAQHVNDQLGELIPYILDGGACQVGIESTVIGIENASIVVYRMGGITIEELQKVTNFPIWVKPHSTSNPHAPGMLESHYAPRKKVMLFDSSKEYDKENLALISFEKDYGFKHQVILSTTGNLSEAAAHLFAALRKTDNLPVEAILVELVPEEGIGRAINDRLKRSSVR